MLKFFIHSAELENQTEKKNESPYFINNKRSYIDTQQC